MKAARRLTFLVLGWTLVVVGIAALVLPGPGLLTILAGVLVLSQEHDWAKRHVEPLRRRAFDAAEQSVQTWPRIVVSTLSASALVVIGVIWGLNPTIPTFGPVGPQLPFSGWGTGAGIIISGLFALALIGYSIRRFGGRSRPG